MKKIKSPGELQGSAGRDQNRVDPDNPCIAICAGTGCLAYGTQKLVDKFREEIETAEARRQRSPSAPPAATGFANAAPWP